MAHAELVWSFLPSYPFIPFSPCPLDRLFPGGILTVADELLQNNGLRFLEMMEQLAVARSVREEQNIRDMQEETDEEDYDEEKE
jgi:hypothetical protein